nr:hypothetical protein [uncultured Halomonas sp.]
MAIFSVNYDLRLPQEYNEFYDVLETYPHIHAMDSCWLIETDVEAGTIRDALMPHIASGDAVFVNRLSDDWAGTGIHCEQWLKQRAKKYA